MKVWHNLQKKNGQRIPWCRDKAIQLCLFYMQYNYIYWTNCYVKQLFYLGVRLIKKKKKTLVSMAHNLTTCLGSHRLEGMGSSTYGRQSLIH